MTTTMKNTGAFTQTFAGFASANTQADNAKAQLIADIVSMCRDSADMDAVPLLQYTVETMDDEGNTTEQVQDFVYADVLALALGEAEDYAKKKATIWFDRVIMSAPAGRTLLSNIKRLEGQKKTLDKIAKDGGLLRAQKADLDDIVADLDAEKQKRNTLVTSLKRAFKVAAHVIEKHRAGGGSAPFKTLMRKHASIVYEDYTGEVLDDGTNEKAWYPLPVTAYADTFGMEYARKWVVPTAADTPQDGDTVSNEDADVVEDASKTQGKGADQRKDAVPSLSLDAGAQEFADFVMTWIARHSTDKVVKGDAAEALFRATMAMQDYIDRTPAEAAVDAA